MQKQNGERIFPVVVWIVAETLQRDADDSLIFAEWLANCSDAEFEWSVREICCGSLDLRGLDFAEVRARLAVDGILP